MKGGGLKWQMCFTLKMNTNKHLQSICSVINGLLKSLNSLRKGVGRDKQWNNSHIFFKELTGMTTGNFDYQLINMKCNFEYATRLNSSFSRSPHTCLHIGYCMENLLWHGISISAAPAFCQLNKNFHTLEIKLQVSVFDEQYPFS